MLDQNWQSLRDMQTKALTTLSDSEDLNYSTNRFHSYFSTIADAILNKSILTVNFNKKYRILEIEFYLNDGLVHFDTFASDILRNEEAFRQKSQI